MSDPDRSVINAHAPMEVIFLDVGQGCCTIIVTPAERKVIMVDCKQGKGPFTLRYLRERGLDDPSVICVSHLHDDHGGLADICDYLIRQGRFVERVFVNPVGRTSKRRRYSCQAFEDRLEDLLDEDISRCCDFRVESDTFTLDSVSLTVLHPNTFDLHRHHSRQEMLNDLSGVMRVVYGRSAVLLPGDIAAWGVAKMLRRYAANTAMVRSSLLLLPHHGAGWDEPLCDRRQVAGYTKSVPAFLEAVDPKWSVVSVGSDNDGHWNEWEHPSLSVLRSLNERGWETGARFACTEVTPHCHPEIAGRAMIPCAGSIIFSLYPDGSIELKTPADRNLQSTISGWACPQCRQSVRND